jgi:hypothetical protein
VSEFSNTVQSEDYIMLNSGYLNLPSQENQTRVPTVDDAVAAWRTWTPDQRIDFGQGVGVAELWDGAIVPAVTNPTAVSLVPVTTVASAEVVS